MGGLVIVQCEKCKDWLPPPENNHYGRRASYDAGIKNNPSANSIKKAKAARGATGMEGFEGRLLRLCSLFNDGR
jgi:hypothetical protein